MQFDRAFVISLKHRKARLKGFLDRLPKTSWMPEIEVVEGIVGDVCRPPDGWHSGNGAWGCARSHIRILEDCLNGNVGSYIVFEDDAHFRPQFAGADAWFDSLPDDWEMAYLGGQLMHAKSHPPTVVAEGVLRPFNVNRTHCFAVSRNGMLPIYQHLSLMPWEKHFHIDHHLGRLHEDARNRVYCPRVWMVGQHGSSSSVSGKTEPVEFYPDPGTYVEDHWLYDKPICFSWRGAPAMRRECEFLHFGNQLSVNGFDVSLEEAVRLRRPERAISGWYSWVRSECVASEWTRLPCAYHPAITDAELAAALDCPVVPIMAVANVEEVRTLVSHALREHRGVSCDV